MSETTVVNGEEIEKLQEQVEEVIIGDKLAAQQKKKKKKKKNKSGAAKVYVWPA